MTLHINTPPPEETPEVPLAAWLRSRVGPWFLTRVGRLTVSLAITVFLAMRGVTGLLGIMLLPIVVACVTTIILIAMPTWRREGYVLAARTAPPAAFVFVLCAGLLFLSVLNDFGASPRTAEKLRQAKRLGLAVVLQIPVVLLARGGVKEMNLKSTNAGNTNIDHT
jgi:hypothetical protein